MSGKIKSIERNANSKRPDLEFGYDAAGNRIYKTVKPRTGSGLTSETEWTTTYYTRDASGNQMAVYEMKTISDPDGTLNDQMQMKEFDIYGSSRLGVYNVPLEQANIAFAPTQNRGYLPSKYVQNSLTLSSTDALVKSYSIGYKFFEQSNHLGNVSSVFSDKKIAIDNNNDGVIDGYISDVISASDYYAFGSLRSNRSYQSDAYRFTFNGKESINEFSGNGNDLDFGARMYDPRIGRWLSVDPMAIKYPDVSPYVFVADNPIMFKDGDGRVIVDPKNDLPIVKVDGEWKTIKGTNKDGTPKYGKVSSDFKNYSQPVLDKLTATKVGTEIYEKLQQVPTKIQFDLDDELNLNALDLKKSNSEWRTANDDFSLDKDGYLKDKVIITPNMDKIKSTAKSDGVLEEEKFLQVISVEAYHTTNTDQIATEAKYNHNYDMTDPKQMNDVYSKPLNNAIKVGKEYRKEKGLKIDNKSNIPVTKFNKATKANIKITE